MKYFQFYTISVYEKFIFSDYDPGLLIKRQLINHFSVSLTL